MIALDIYILVLEMSTLAKIISQSDINNPMRNNSRTLVLRTHSELRIVHFFVNLTCKSGVPICRSTGNSSGENRWIRVES